MINLQLQLQKLIQINLKLYIIIFLEKKNRIHTKIKFITTSIAIIIK